MSDQELITGGSEDRRRFMDSIISQYDRRYLEDLIRYNQVLAQRNSLLRRGPFPGWNSFAVWDEQLAMLGTSIHEKRLEFIEAFRSIFSKIYNQIAGDVDQVTLEYESTLRETCLDELLVRNRQRDTEMQYTTAGIHKDDLAIGLEGRPAKRIASQGQQKSIVIALKLAHYEYLSEMNAVKPILLLDDIFDKLDDKRVGRLMELVTKHSFGQIFITDTHPERVPYIFERIHVPVRVFQVENGLVTEPFTGISK